jgi:hypothetical protein
MTFLPVGEVAAVEAVRQKGEAELGGQCQYGRRGRGGPDNVRGAVCVQGSEVLATPGIVMSVRLVVWMDTNRPAPFPGDGSANAGHARACRQQKTNLLLLLGSHGGLRLWESCRQRPAARLRAPGRPLVHPSIAPATPSSAHTSATARCFSSPDLSQPLLLCFSPPLLLSPPLSRHSSNPPTVVGCLYAL